MPQAYVKRGEIESLANDPDIKKQQQIYPIAQNTHDAVAVDIIGGNERQNDAIETEHQSDQLQNRPAALLAIPFPPCIGEHQREYEVAQNAPYGHRYAQENGIRALGNRVTIYGLTDGTKTAVADIGINPIMGNRQIDGIC